jgi:hypothetical protein
MFFYKVTFTDNTTVKLRANSPRQAEQVAKTRHMKEVLRITYLR